MTQDTPSISPGLYLHAGAAHGSKAGPQPAVRGLVVTADRSLVRSFRRELKQCADCSVSVDVEPRLEDAGSPIYGSYHWVAIDLDAAVAPSEEVRLARRLWPGARIAVFSCWWSERDTIARDLADAVIHKPVRAPEVLRLLRGLDTQASPAPASAPQEDTLPAAIA